MEATDQKDKADPAVLVFFGSVERDDLKDTTGLVRRLLGLISGEVGRDAALSKKLASALFQPDLAVNHWVLDMPSLCAVCIAELKENKHVCFEARDGNQKPGAKKFVGVLAEELRKLLDEDKIEETLLMALDLYCAVGKGENNTVSSLLQSCGNRLANGMDDNILDAYIDGLVLTNKGFNEGMDHLRLGIMQRDVDGYWGAKHPKAPVRGMKDAYEEAVEAIKSRIKELDKRPNGRRPDEEIQEWRRLVVMLKQVVGDSQAVEEWCRKELTSGLIPDTVVK